MFNDSVASTQHKRYLSLSLITTHIKLGNAHYYLNLSALSD